MRIFLCLISISAFASPQLKIDLVTELHAVMEASHEQVFLDGKLFSVNSPAGAIEVYRDSQTKLASIRLPHSMSRIAASPYGDLFVFGKTQNPWGFFFTSIDSKTFRLRTEKLDSGLDVFPDRFTVSSSSEIFFSDIPGRGVWRYHHGATPRKFSADIAVPTHLVVVGGYLYVVENYGLGSEHSNLVKINLTTQATTRLFDKTNLPGMFSDLKLLPDGHTLAVSQVWNDQVSLIDTRTDKIASTFPITGRPRSAHVLGRCLVIASEESKQVNFLEWNSGETVSTWDLTPAGDRLKAPGTISLDAKNGRIFARSAYPCFGCGTTQSSLFSVEELEPTTFNRCLSTFQLKR